MIVNQIASRIVFLLDNSKISTQKISEFVTIVQLYAGILCTAYHTDLHNRIRTGSTVRRRYWFAFDVDVSILKSAFALIIVAVWACRIVLPLHWRGTIRTAKSACSRSCIVWSISTSVISGRRKCASLKESQFHTCTSSKIFTRHYDLALEPEFLGRYRE